MKGHYFTKLVTEQRRLGRHIVAEERQFDGQERSPRIFLILGISTPDLD